MELESNVKDKIKKIASRYPNAESVILPSLHLLQRKYGYITPELVDELSKLIDVQPDKIYSTATLYTMINLKPVGKYHLQVCKNLSCSLLGSADIAGHLSGKLGIGVGETSRDGNFTLSLVECLGACGGSPVMMINDKYYENLTIEKLDRIIEELK